MTAHSYRASCTWSGSTGVGYEHYSRAHGVSAPPASTSLQLSADEAFRGDARLLNPESLVVMAACSCQLLSFLAVAARARIDVVGYEDEAEGLMDESDLPVRIGEIRLRPHITIEGEFDEARLRHLVELAHKECFIANSLSSTITVSPSFHAS